MEEAAHPPIQGLEYAPEPEDEPEEQPQDAPVSEPPAEAVFSPEGLQVVSPAPRFQVRFRLVEIYEEIREQIRERKDREK